MNDIQINVEDYSLVKTSIINNIKIRIMKIDLYKSVTLSVSLLTNNMNIDNKLITISGDDYTKWGNDDNYIINFVLNNLGLTKKI